VRRRCQRTAARVIEHHEQPVVSVTLSFRAAGIYEPAGKEGLSGLVAELLSKGTDGRGAEQIAATIEGDSSWLVQAKIHLGLVNSPKNT